MLTQDEQLNHEVIWRPFPGSQQIALDSRADQTLYHGSRGPGKTITQLMRFFKHVGKGYGQFWRGIIFDLEFDHLGGLVAESKKWFSKFDDGAKFLESHAHYKWVWPTGEELLFRHAKKIADYEGFHGWEIPFIGWNELTKHHSADLYDKFLSINRSTFDPIKNTPFDKSTGLYLTPDGKPLPPIPLNVFSTTNPNGIGHNWIKARFIDPAPPGEVVRTSVPIFNPQTQKDEIFVSTQVAIFGSYKENPLLPAKIIADLESIVNDNLRRAWLYGDWDVTAGGALDDLWDSKVHILPRFVIPPTWYVDRAYDDGSSHPFSVGWFAESDGTDAEIVGSDGVTYTFCPPAGTLVQIFEWYGAQYIGSNEGLLMSSTNIGKGIADIDKALFSAGWVSKKPNPGPADNRIRQVIDSDLDTTEKLMERQGVSWIPSDKSSGSRIIGLQLLRDRLEASLKNEGPGIYFMRNCKASIALLPALPRDPVKLDDVDTKAQDHCYDMVRYRALKGRSKPMNIFKVSTPT